MMKYYLNGMIHSLKNKHRPMMICIVYTFIVAYVQVYMRDFIF